MKPSSKQASRPILISIQPRFAEKILAGEKALEFRRTWPINPVEALVIYSSSPKQRIVAIAKVGNVHFASPTALWELRHTKKPGITRRELYDYFSGKPKGYAIELTQLVKANDEGLNPKELLRDFAAPQSFAYLDAEEYAKIARSIST